MTCQEDPAAACDLSGPWTDGVSLFVTGTLITGLTPNTDYQCFVKASYVIHLPPRLSDFARLP